MVRRTGLALATLVAMGCGSVAGTSPDGGGAGRGGAGGGSAGSPAGASGAGGASSGGSGGASGASGLAGGGGVGGASAGSGGSGGAAAGGGSVGGGGASGAGGASAGRGGSGGVAGAGGGPAGAGGGPAGAGGGPAGAGGAAGTSVRVFNGQTAIVLQSGPACTSQQGATGDRWCAFVAASPTSATAFDLFVVNISRAAAGVTVTCGPTPDPNCLRLTAQFAEDANHPAFFQGDTLVYFDITATGYGWRPGMTAGRVLAQPSATIADVVLCVPDTIGTAVFCLGVLASQPDPDRTMTDLLVGKLDSTLTPALSRVETVMAFNTADGDVPRFQVGFPSPGTDTIAWSGRATPTGPEILKRQTIGNDATRATVASDVHNWAASPDGSRWYWLSAVDGYGFGTLQSSPFSSGASPVTLATDVVQFLFPAGQALVYLNTSYEALAVADPVGAPTAVTTLAIDVLGFSAISRQGDVAYVTDYDGNTMLSDLRVRRWNSTSGGCTLTGTTNSLGGIFSPDSGAVVWVRDNNGASEMLYSRLSDCSSTSVSPGVLQLDTVGDRAVMYLDTLVRPPVGGPSIPTGTLRAQLVGANHTLAATASMVSQQVGSVATAAPNPTVIIYSVNGRTAADGVYIRIF